MRRDVKSTKDEKNDKSLINKSSSISESEEEFRTIEKKSRKILLKIKTVFPFDLFTDSIIIDPFHVNIVTRKFFSTGDVRSIIIEDIGDIMAEGGPVFGTLKIRSKMIGSQEPITISHLKKEDVIKARNLIQELVTSTRERIKIEKVATATLKKGAEGIGNPSETK